MTKTIRHLRANYPTALPSVVAVPVVPQPERDFNRAATSAERALTAPDKSLARFHHLAARFFWAAACSATVIAGLDQVRALQGSPDPRDEHALSERRASFFDRCRVS